MREMKILFLINGLRYGGMERQLVETIISLNKVGHIIFLAVLNQEGPLSEVVSPYLDREIIYLDRRKKKIASTIVKLVKICKNYKPDIIHVQDGFSAFYSLPCAKLLRIKFVNGLIRNAGYSKGFSFLFEKLLLNLSDYVIANSQAGLDYYSVKNGSVIYNFINTERFRLSTGNLENIVMNANFSEKKDHMTLFEACKKLIKENRIQKIGLIGAKDNLQFYKDLAVKWDMHNKIVFYGHVKNIEEIISQYGIGVLCSTKQYKEGISNSILEYLGAGLIAVGTNIGGTPEIIQDGVNGFLFEAENANSLYNKISYVLDHSEQMDSIRQRAYITLEEKFNEEKNCVKLMNLYKNLVND